jgi:HTH-type transcriptional regulator/antitoxin HigA
MNALAVSSEYLALLRKVPPRVIRSEVENEMFTEILYELDLRSGSLSRAEQQLAELLTVLIEDFEEKRYRLPRAKPVQVLRFLMEQNGLKQKDLVKVFGTASIVSEVLRGKRTLSKTHIKRLCRRFHISPELFF